MVMDTFSLGDRNKHQIRIRSACLQQVQDVSEYSVDPSQNLDRTSLSLRNQNETSPGSDLSVM